MLQYLEQGIVLAVMAGITVLAMLDKLFVRRLYRRLIKQSDNIGQTKIKFLKQMKQKFENGYRMNEGMRNSRVFVEKQLNHYRVLGLSLRGIDNLCGQAPWAVALLGIGASFAVYWFNLPFELIVIHICAGLFLGIACFIWDNLADTAGCRDILLVQLGDYIDNTLTYRLERNEVAEDALETAEQETQRQKEIDYLKRSLSQIAAGREEEPKEVKPPRKKLTEEEEQVIKDIIKEYLG